MAELEEFVAGSEDILRGTIYDRQDGVLVPFNLTGGTVTVKARLNKSATLKSWTCVIDPDQGAHPGRFTYQLLATDLPTPGLVELEAYVTSGDARVHKSNRVEREVRGALV